MSESPKRIVVCADDFGLTAAASKSIVSLAECGAISATSCAVDGPYAKAFASDLLSATRSCAFGLHLNLTENTNFAFSASLQSWLLRCFVYRSVDRNIITREINRQLDLFETLFGQAPHFVDGHEHVHQFPNVREPLIESLLARYRTRVAVRSTVSAHRRGFKAFAIATLGGQRMRKLLLNSALTTNSDFAGVYDFSARVPYAKRMHSWIDSLVDGGLLMCHPEVSSASSAALNAREAEHEYLSSTQWSALLRAGNVQLVPFHAQTISA